jgi:hypothetical protein
MERTSKERRTLHELVWERMAKDGCIKEDAIEALGFNEESGTAPVNDCFACEEVGIDSRGESQVIEKCVLCPVIWGTESQNKDHKTAYCERKGSPYYEYMEIIDETDSLNISRIAKRVLSLKYKDAWIPTKKCTPGKPKPKIQRKLIVNGVKWYNDDEVRYIYPNGDIQSDFEIDTWEDLLDIPEMKMTLEWEE